MTRRTIKLPDEDYERHNERRKANGQTWAEYVDGQAPEVEAGATPDEVREIIRDEHDSLLERLLDSLRTRR